MGDFVGVHRAKVVNNVDPESRFRLLLQFPGLSLEPEWALACTPVGVTDLPPVDSTVWVAFEGRDSRRPVWIGILR
jgi:hypothetical protein